MFTRTLNKSMTQAPDSPEVASSREVLAAVERDDVEDGEHPEDDLEVPRGECLRDLPHWRRCEPMNCCTRRGRDECPAPSLTLKD